MPPNGAPMETVGPNVLVLVVLLAAVLTTVGLITCVVTHYHHSHHHHLHHHHHHHHHQAQSTQESTACSLATAQLIWNTPSFSNSSNLRNSSRFNATTVPMLALEASMERERCALHDRQVRLHSVHTDLGLDLPTSIHLPDGEEIPYGSSTRLHIRDPEQESEIYRKCIRPPPNRTIEQSETILPYRSSSTGLLSLSSSSSTNSSNEWGQNVVRCHSMSSRYTAAVNVPSVIIPSASAARHQQHLHSGSHTSGSHKVSAGLAKITMVPCLTDHRSSPATVDTSTASAEAPASATSSKGLSSSSSSCSTSSSSSATSSSSKAASSGSAASGSTTSSTVSRLSTSLTIAPTFVRQL